MWRFQWHASVFLSLVSVLAPTFENLDLKTLFLVCKSSSHGQGRPQKQRYVIASKYRELQVVHLRLKGNRVFDVQVVVHLKNM